MFFTMRIDFFSRSARLINRRRLTMLTTSDLIFTIPKLISFLSLGTTLPAGTIILTGTPAGIGMASKPDGYLKDGDEFAVEIQPHIGTLVSRIEYEVQTER